MYVLNQSEQGMRQKRARENCISSDCIFVRELADHVLTNPYYALHI